MALINNGQVLGSGSTDLILNTRGKIYVRVGDVFYELDFKNKNGNTNIVNNTIQNPEQDLSPYVTKKYLKAALGEYVTKRNWEDVMQTKEALENAQLDEFTESITPITVNTMQMVVGTQNLQFDFINSLTDDTIVSPGLYINESGQLVCPRGVIKHYTLFGPESVKPETSIEYYARWTIQGDNGGDYAILDLEEEDKPYYVYLRVPTDNFNSYTDDYVAEHITEDPKGQYIGDWFVSIESHAIDELEGYAYLLVALVTGSNAGGRSIGYLNGFTEILPGQITAYVFKTADGNQYLDFLNKRFKIGDDATGYLKWDIENGLELKGKLSVIPGGDIDDKFNNLQAQIDDEVQCWFSTDSSIKQYIPLPNKDNKTATPNWPVNTSDWVNKEHIGDLYYVVEDDSSTQSINEQGQAYRYIKDGNLYYWTRIVDNSISLALYNAYLAQQAANKAQDILDDIANDNVITVQEHRQLQELLNSVLAQCDQTIASADPYKTIQTVATAISNLKTKKDILSTVVNAILERTDTYTISEEYQNAWNNVFEALKTLSTEIATESNDQITKAQNIATEAKNKFSEWANDGVISPLEVSGIETELNFINNDYLDQENKKNTFNLSDTNEWKAYYSAYTNYKNSLQLVLDWWNDVKGTDNKTTTYPIPNNFDTNLQSYYNTRLAFIKVALNASLITDIDYIKKAIKGRTDIEGGLVLTGLIELGFGLTNSDNENYYNSFIVMSGINGILEQKDESNNYTYTDPAVWFGGNMLDLENINDQNDPEIYTLFIQKNGGEYNKYIKNDNIESRSFYKWIKNNESDSYYSITASGDIFINSSFKSEQALGTKYAFDCFLNYTFTSTNFTNSSGNTEILSGTIQAYKYSRTNTLWTVYNKNNEIIGLNGVFDSYLVQSHTSNDSINLKGTTIYTYAKNADESIKGIVFQLDNESDNRKYYIECSPILQEILGIMYKNTSSSGEVTVDIYKPINTENLSLYEWIYNNDIIYTLTDYTKKPDRVYLLPDENTVQYAENYTIINYFNNFAKSMFRMNGSGYLANGNISWDTDGNITMKDISVQSGNIGPLKIISEESKSSVKVTSKNVDILNITNDSVSINGKLTAKSDWDSPSAIIVSDPLDVQIFNVSAQPLSTENIPTYIRRSSDETFIYGKGTIFGGTVTIPKNAWYPILEPQYLLTYATYTITNFELKYDIAKISSPIKGHIYAVPVWDLSEEGYIMDSYKIELYQWTWNSGQWKGEFITNDLTTKSFSVPALSGLGNRKWGIYLYLEPGGQVKSGIGSDSWIHIWATTNNEAEIKLKDTKPIPGTFIGSNGISSIFGEKTKFQWIVPSAKNSSYGNTDPRSTGGIFYIEVPFNNDQSQTVGLRVIGFKGADGAPQSSAGIQINTGSGWHKIDFDNEGILRISD